MIQWYKKVVLENYANFKGRARRSEYWYFILVNFIVQLVFLSLFFVFLSMDMAGIGFVFYGLMMIFSLAMMVPSLAVAVRRMHDVGKSGWYILIPVYSLILALTNGEEGTNQYGDDPKKNNEFEQIGQE
jgi:uncharacterized membrane protein YhaH (DUF805 family)